MGCQLPLQAGAMWSGEKHKEQTWRNLQEAPYEQPTRVLLASHTILPSGVRDPFPFPLPFPLTAPLAAFLGRGSVRNDSRRFNCFCLFESAPPGPLPPCTGAATEIVDGPELPTLPLLLPTAANIAVGLIKYRSLHPRSVLASSSAAAKSLFSYNTYLHTSLRT